MRSWPSLLALIAMLAPLSAACVGEETEPDDGPWKSLKARPCPDDNFLTWENFGSPFMDTWCNGCHGAGLPDGMRQGAPVGVDFDTLDDVRRQDKRIWARAADQNDTMPPIGGPDDEERAMLGEWLACGSP